MYNLAMFACVSVSYILHTALGDVVSFLPQSVGSRSVRRKVGGESH